MGQPQPNASVDTGLEPPHTLHGRSPSLRLICLGGFELWQDGVLLHGLDTANYQALLTYLALHAGKPQSRQHLAFQFWPDSSEAQARTSLRKAIHQLRQHLPQATDILRVERPFVQWQPDAPVSVDVMVFETAVTRADQAATPAAQKEHLTQAITHYQGDFLPDHYEEWALAARERLHQKYLTCLETLIQLLEGEQDYPAAITYAQRLLRADPLHEVAYRRLMRLQAGNGRIAAALRTYHTCATTLQNELGVSPSPATQALYEQLLQSDAPQITPYPARTPLVARENEWAALQAAWQQASQHAPRLALISGEAGIGKTRLAEELLSWAARRGITTLSSACYAAQGRLPYAPIAAWLRAEVMQKIIGRLGDKWVVELSRLLPELLARRPDLNPPGPLTEAWQRQHFFTALAHAILQARPPLLLFIDDLQWCDQDTLEWLHFLLHFQQQARFLLLGTLRSEEVGDDHLLTTMQQHLQRNGSLVTIPLARLDTAATRTLAEHVTRQELDRPQAEWLYIETEGNPLFVVEMSRAGLPHSVNSGQYSAAWLPDKVRAVLEMRLGQLSTAARELAGLAAVIGRSFIYDLLAACTPDEEKLVRCLDELWQRRIVREQEGAAYDFSHDKLRQAAYTSLSTARRRLLHRQVAAAMEAGCAGPLDEISHQLAAHYEAMGSYAAAIDHYRRAAAVTERIYAHQETLTHVQRALALLPQVDASGEMWAALLGEQAAALALMGEYEKAREVLETAVAHTPHPIQKARLLCQQGDAWAAQQQQAAALAAYDQALAVLGAKAADAAIDWQHAWLDVQLCRAYTFYFLSRLAELADLTAMLREPLAAYGTQEQRRRYLNAGNMLAFHQKRFRLDADDVVTCKEILGLAEESANAHVMAASRFAVGFAYLWSGVAVEAIDHLEAAQRQAAECGNVYLQDQTLAYLTQAYRALGDVARVRELVAQHEQVAAQSENPFYGGMLAGQRAWLCYKKGEWKTAVKHGEQALAIWGTLPFPLQGIALWPLLATAVAQGQIAQAAAYAAQLLQPSQQLLGEEVTAVLQGAVAAWDAKQPESTLTHLKQALQIAEKIGYL